MQPFTAYNATNNANGVSPDFNYAGATDTERLLASDTLSASRTTNAFVLNGNGLTLGLAGSVNTTGTYAPTLLTVTSGGIINTGGSNTISGLVLAFGGNGGLIYVNSNSTLTINSVISGTAGLPAASPAI